MKKSMFAAALGLLLATILPAQVVVQFCPDLQSQVPPSQRLGTDYRPQAPTTCTYCTASCMQAIDDPIGGYTLGYFLYKDKNAERWQLFYRIGTDKDVILADLNAAIDNNKYKLQDRKQGIAVLEVPLNRALSMLSDEVETIMTASKRDFISLSEKQQPWGDLAQVFARWQIEGSTARLSTPYKIDGRVDAMFVQLEAALDAALPQYRKSPLSDSSMVYEMGAETPSMELVVARNAKELQWIAHAPARKDPPRFKFTAGQLRPGKGAPDTLVSQRLGDGSLAFAIGLTDESMVGGLSCDGQPLTLMVRDSISWAFIPLKSMQNLKQIQLEARDEHGNTVGKSLVLLRQELDPPRFLLLNPKENIYTEPESEFVLDKFGEHFTLRGVIRDESPIRSFTVNGLALPLNEDNTFEYPLQHTDNGREFKVAVVDVFGNKIGSKFRLQFKESGMSRKLKPEVNEEFATSNPAHLKRHGQQGLNLSIHDDRFYLSRSVVVDSGSSAQGGTESNSEHANKIAIAPLGFQPLDFNADFELRVTFKQVVAGSKFIFTFGMNEREDSYFFLWGERDNLFLGQVENGQMQCFGEGCPQNAMNRIYASYSYLHREVVRPNFFDNGTSVEYSLNITRYNKFYLGAKDDPQDYLFITIDNHIDKPVEMRYKLSGGNGRISGTNVGFGLEEGAHVGVSQFVFRKGLPTQGNAFFEDKETERYCFPTCFKVDSTKGGNFFDCLTDDYHALIVANGEFANPAFAKLDSTVSRARQLRQQLVGNYQFPEQQVQLMENATKGDFLKQLETDLPRHLTEKDRLVLYIVTHGTQDQQLAFADGEVAAAYIWSQLNERKPDGTPKYRCNQILVVVDACFSGDMAPNKGSETNPNREVCQAVGLKSRLLLSTAANTTTRDSEFTRAIVDQLHRCPTRFVTIDKLFEQAGEDFLKATMGGSRPSLTIFDPTTHEPNGSFLFVKKKFYH